MLQMFKVLIRTCTQDKINLFEFSQKTIGIFNWTITLKLNGKVYIYFWIKVLCHEIIKKNIWFMNNPFCQFSMTLSNKIDLWNAEWFEMNFVWFLTYMKFVAYKLWSVVQWRSNRFAEFVNECAAAWNTNNKQWTMNMQTHYIADTYVVPKIIRSIL